MKENKNLTTMIMVGVAILMLVNLTMLVINYKTVKEITNTKKETISPQEKIRNHSFLEDPLSLENYSKLNISTNGTTIILSQNCTRIVLPLNEIQLYSIKNALENKIDVRPTIHDVMKSSFEVFNISLMLVKITETKDDIYFSKMYFKSNTTFLSIDTKPSDAIALALRTNTPIYINNNIIAKYAEKIC